MRASTVLALDEAPCSFFSHQHRQFPLFPPGSVSLSTVTVEKETRKNPPLISPYLSEVSRMRNQLPHSNDVSSIISNCAGVFAPFSHLPSHEITQSSAKLEGQVAAQATCRCHPGLWPKNNATNDQEEFTILGEFFVDVEPLTRVSTLLRQWTTPSTYIHL